MWPPVLLGLPASVAERPPVEPGGCWPRRHHGWRGGHRADPRNGVHPDLPARPPGERPEPEPASVAAMQTFAHGGVPESYGYSAGQGYFPFVFGLNLQGASLREAPAMCKKTSYMLVGLSFCYAFTLFLL
mmetsp:Transcript_40905/g.131550  ORF Transcript_40905/g.131550 Transcript_40905/m.131550 type:complete len:130 (+) Transcript_40905:134-523(+)